MIIANRHTSRGKDLSGFQNLTGLYRIVLDRFGLVVLFTLLMANISGCDVFNSDNSNGQEAKMVPDNTPFIASTLEVTADTVHHYPEVYVGRVDNIVGYYDDRFCCQVIEGIWWPTLNAQVNKTARIFDLKRVDVNLAEVSVTGPLDAEYSKTVQFKSEGLGVYGDQSYELELVPRGKYQLDVKMPDGSLYRAFTQLPSLPVWNVPDTLRPELELLTNGEQYVEQIPGDKRVKLEYKEAPEADLTIEKINESDDRETFDLDEDDEFLFQDKSNFLRKGTRYFIRHNKISSFADSTWIGPRWHKYSDDILYETVDVWMFLRQINSDLAYPWTFQPSFNLISRVGDDFWSQTTGDYSQKIIERDTTYLFEISNILKVGKNGEVLPEEKSDAIGVFGGFSTAYRKTVMKPQRSWDPDSLGWGPDNP